MRKGKKSLKIPQGVIRISNSKKDRQHNGQKKKAKEQTTITLFSEIKEIE
jgi:hypothetical protein